MALCSNYLLLMLPLYKQQYRCSNVDGPIKPHGDSTNRHAVPLTGVFSAKAAHCNYLEVNG